ncbi:oxaloacetate decarboxylase subunit beta, partial [Salmonella enterica subsp. enterica serovar Newport str. SHSN003]
MLAHHDAGQLAVIAAKLNCAPDVHAIKEALALALPSVQSQMENLAVDMGYKKKRQKKKKKKKKNLLA